MADKRYQNKRQKHSNNLTLFATVLVVILVVTVVGLIVTSVNSKKKKSSTKETKTASVTQAPSADTPAGDSGEEEAVPTDTPTPTPDPDDLLPDGTIYEKPTKAGSAYMYNNQVFAAACAGESIADYYANMVNSVADKLDGKAKLYDIVVPTAFGACLSAEVQEEMVGNNQAALIDYLYGKVTSDNAYTVDACSKIIKHNAEYIYFKSDHHWTVTGAYYAYVAWCNAKGIEAHSTDFFEETQEFDGFLGSFYSLAGKPSSLDSDRDTVLAYVPNGTNDEVFTGKDGVDVKWSVIQDVSGWASSSKYNCFIGGDNPKAVIENPDITDGSACILIKESYGNAFAPFLVDHYQYTYIFDYRYYTGDLTSFVTEHNVQDVIIVNNMEAIGTDRADQINNLFK